MTHDHTPHIIDGWIAELRLAHRSTLQRSRPAGAAASARAADPLAAITAGVDPSLTSPESLTD